MLSLLEVARLGELVLYFVIVGFAWLLPLRRYIGSWREALRFSIPLSISIQIIFAYVFYTIGWAEHYYLVYLPFVVLLNIWCLIGHDRVVLPKFGKQHLGASTVATAVLVALAFLYSRFFDSFSTIAPGAIDTFNHMRFIGDLHSNGVLSLPAYPPGFHLLVSPVSRLVGETITYRFVGPVLGVLSGVALFLAMGRIIQDRFSRLLVLALLSSPIFALLSLQTMSFFPTALTFIIFPAFLSLLFQPSETRNGQLLLFAIILTLGLSVTVPYLYVQIIPAFAVLLALSWLLRRQLSNVLYLRTGILTIVLIGGFIVAFLHTLIQNDLHSSNSPFITVSILAPEPAASSPASDSNDMHSRVYTNYGSPLIRTAKEVLRPKGLRPPTTFLSLAAYIWGVISCGLLYWGIRRRQSAIILLACLSIVFTIITQTGVLELGSYRGRSGWYLLLLALLTLVVVWDQWRDEIGKVWQSVVLVLLASLGFIYPPTFYRPFYPGLFDMAAAVAKNSAEQKRIVFYTNEPELSIFSRKIIRLPVTLEALQAPCETGEVCYLFWEKNYHFVDPVLTQQLEASQLSPLAISAQAQKDKEMFEQKSKAIIGSGVLNNFDLINDSDQLALYQQRNSQ